VGAAQGKGEKGKGGKGKVGKEDRERKVKRHKCEGRGMRCIGGGTGRTVETRRGGRVPEGWTRRGRLRSRGRRDEE